MAFLCRVVGDDRIFQTVRNQSFLSKLWGTCGGAKDSPLRCVLGHTVYWREGKTPHVYHSRGVNCFTDKGGGGVSPAHCLLQAELIEIGKTLGQTCGFEVVGPQQECRVDVVWLEAQIAWEVDLTQQSPTEQRKRSAIRKNSLGLQMISLAEKVPSRPITPTVALYTASGSDYTLGERFVVNLYGYESAPKGSVALRPMRGVKFFDISAALVDGKLEYLQWSAGGDRSSRWGWRLKSERHFLNEVAVLRDDRMTLVQKQQTGINRTQFLRQKVGSLAERLRAIDGILRSKCLAFEAPPRTNSKFAKLVAGVHSLLDQEKSAQIESLLTSLAALAWQFRGSAEEIESIHRFGREQLVEKSLLARLLSREHALFELRDQIRSSRDRVEAEMQRIQKENDREAQENLEIRKQIKEKNNLIKRTLSDLCQSATNFKRRFGDHLSS